MIDPDVLVTQFNTAATKPVLPPGEGAVHVFAIGAVYGASAPADLGRCLSWQGGAEQ